MTKVSHYLAFLYILDSYVFSTIIISVDQSFMYPLSSAVQTVYFNLKQILTVYLVAFKRFIKFKVATKLKLLAYLDH